MDTQIALATSTGVIKMYSVDGIDEQMEIHHLNGQMLFQANNIGKLLGTANIHASLVKLDATEKKLLAIQTTGGIQQVVFLTTSGLLEFLGAARKPVAKQLRKWILSTLLTDHQGIMAGFQDKIQSLSNELDRASSMSRAAQDIFVPTSAMVLQEQHLVRLHHQQNVVYFGIVGRQGDRLIVKIGSSAYIGNRVCKLKQEFGVFVLINIFECYRHHELEIWLHHHAAIEPCAFNKVINGCKTSTETFLFTDTQLAAALAIARTQQNELESRQTVAKKQKL